MADFHKVPVDLFNRIYDYIGTGDPTTPLPNAAVGSLYRKLDGVSGSTLWQKTASGWEALQGSSFTQATADARYGQLAISNTWAGATNAFQAITATTLTITASSSSLSQTVSANTTTFHLVSINAAAYQSVFGTDSSGVGFVGTLSNHPFTFRANNVEVARFTTSGRLVMALASDTTLLGRAGLFDSAISGNTIWWGHANPDYRNTIGAYHSAGFGYISFYSYQDTGDAFKRAGSTTYPFQIRAEATGQVLNFLYAGLSTADSTISWTSGMSLGAGVLTVASNVLAGGAVFGDNFFSARRSAVEKAYFGIATAANQMITGSVTDDAIIRTVAGSSRFLVSLNNGSSINFNFNDSWMGIIPTTGTNAAYLAWTSTGGSYYIGVDNSAGTSFGFGVYGIGMYTPAGVAWYVNKTTNAMTVAQSLTASDFILSSDMRLKERFQALSNPLDSLEKLSGFSFQYKADTTRRRVGVSAQEVKEVLPEAVVTNADGSLLVSYDSLIPLLIEAVKALRKEVRHGITN